MPLDAFMLRVLGEARPSLWPLVNCLAENDLLLPERFAKSAPRLLLAAIAAAGDGSSLAPTSLVAHLATLPHALLGSTSDGRTALHVAFDRGKSVVEGVLVAALSESGAAARYVDTLRNVTAALRGGTDAGGSGSLAEAVAQSLVKARVPAEDARIGTAFVSADASVAADAGVPASVAVRDMTLPIGRSLRSADLDAFLVALSAGVVRALLPAIEAVQRAAAGESSGSNSSSSRRTLPLLVQVRPHRCSVSLPVASTPPLLPQLMTRRDALGRTPLHAAAAMGDAASVGLLCDRLLAHVPEGLLQAQGGAADAELGNPGSPSAAAAAAAAVPWLRVRAGLSPLCSTLLARRPEQDPS